MTYIVTTTINQNIHGASCLQLSLLTSIKSSDISIKLSINIDVTNTYACIGVYSMVYTHNSVH